MLKDYCGANDAGLSHKMNAKLPPFLADPRILFGWMVAAVLVGLLLQIHPGWTAFAALLPAALAGVWSSLQDDVTPAAPVIITSKPEPSTDTLTTELRPIIRSLD